MLRKIFAKLLKLNIKTIWFNFHYFPFRTAIKLPVFISCNSQLLTLKGKVILKGSIKTGMIELGYGRLGNFDKRNSRFIWDVAGDVVFERNAFIGHGCRIRILESGKIFFGENFVTTAETSFISKKNIHIGNDCLFSWEILIMDTDFHSIYDINNNILNPDKAIIIGNNVWLSCRVNVLKGSIIPSDTVIAAATTISGELNGNHQIFGGTPPRTLKEFNFWKL